LCDAAEIWRAGDAAKKAKVEAALQPILEAALYYPHHACRLKPGELDPNQTETAKEWKATLDAARGSFRLIEEGGDSNDDHKDYTRVSKETNDVGEEKEDRDDPRERTQEEYSNLPSTFTTRGSGPNAQPAKKKRRKRKYEANSEAARAAHSAYLVKNGNVKKGAAVLKPSAIHPPSDPVRAEVCRLLPQKGGGTPAIPDKREDGGVRRGGHRCTGREVVTTTTTNKSMQDHTRISHASQPTHHLLL
jgi:hypothetical protein